MKSIVQIGFMLLSVPFFGETQIMSTIKLSIGDCRKNEPYFWRTDTLFFYKVPEDTVMFKVVPRQYRQFPIKLENIPVSTYKLGFRNNFNQLIIRQIKLEDQKINSITLCPDSLLDYSQNTLSKLQDKDTISISFYSQGCFHATASKILIRKQDEKYMAGLYDVSWNYVTKKKKTTMQFLGGSLLKMVTLTPQNIQDFIRFENELNFITFGGCTTTDWYTVKSKFLNIEKTDGSCSWDGFYFLRKSLFGDKE